MTDRALVHLGVQAFLAACPYWQDTAGARARHDRLTMDPAAPTCPYCRYAARRSAREALRRATQAAARYMARRYAPGTVERAEGLTCSFPGYHGWPERDEAAACHAAQRGSYPWADTSCDVTEGLAQFAGPTGRLSTGGNGGNTTYTPPGPGGTGSAYPDPLLPPNDLRSPVLPRDTGGPQMHGRPPEPAPGLCEVIVFAGPWASPCLRPLGDDDQCPDHPSGGAQ